MGPLQLPLPVFLEKTLLILIRRIRASVDRRRQTQCSYPVDLGFPSLVAQSADAATATLALRQGRRGRLRPGPHEEERLPRRLMGAEHGLHAFR